LSLLSNVEEHERKLRSSAGRLCCAARLTTLLLKLLSGLSDVETEKLEAAIGNADMEIVEQGWEESVDAALTHLLHTSLAKAGKEPVSMPVAMVPVKDTARLKKHLLLVVDRLSKGGRLQTKEGDTSSQVPIIQVEDQLPLDDSIGEMMNPLLPERIKSASRLRQTLPVSEEPFRPSTAVTPNPVTPEVVTSTYEEADDIIAF